jgi:hypothetical protein
MLRAWQTCIARRGAEVQYPGVFDPTMVRLHDLHLTITKTERIRSWWNQLFVSLVWLDNAEERDERFVVEGWMGDVDRVYAPSGSGASRSSHPLQRGLRDLHTLAGTCTSARPVRNGSRRFAWGRTSRSFASRC